MNGLVNGLKVCLAFFWFSDTFAILSVRKPLVLNFSKNVDFDAVNHHQIAVVSSFDADV